MAIVAIIKAISEIRMFYFQSLYYQKIHVQLILHFAINVSFWIQKLTLMAK